MTDTINDTPQTENKQQDTKKSATPQVTAEKSVTVNVNAAPAVEAKGMEMLSTPEGKAIAEKVRQEEKAKLYSKMERLETERKKIEDEKSQLLEKQKELETQLSSTQKETAGTAKDIESRLADMQEQVKLAALQKDVVMEEAAKMIRANELKNLREQRIAKEDIVLAELIPETIESPEQLDAAITAAKAKQEAMAEQIRNQLRSEMGANVPGPLAPEQQSQTPTETMATDPARRQEFARLPKDEYNKIREELIKKAEQATGWRRQ